MISEPRIDFNRSFSRLSKNRPLQFKHRSTSTPSNTTISIDDLHLGQFTLVPLLATIREFAGGQDLQRILLLLKLISKETPWFYEPLSSGQEPLIFQRRADFSRNLERLDFVPMNTNRIESTGLR